VSVLRVPLGLTGAGRVTLERSAAHYVTRVRRLRVGDGFVAFDPARACEADAVLVEARGATAVCELGQVRAASLVPARKLWLLQGECKRDAFDLVVRDATALAVTDLVPVVLSRSGPAGRATGRERWRRIAVESARQCGRGDVPRLHEACPLAQAVALVGLHAARVALFERAERPAGEAISRFAGHDEIAIAVGPEGGFADEEAEALAGAGYSLVSMGRLILRAETAATAVLGAVAAAVAGGGVG
jgi:16S rRNA (uracil1498-N3)-methyltransferase